MRKIGTLGILTAMLLACSNDETAGVITETESGKTATKIVNLTGSASDENGSPLQGVEVNLLRKDHIAARTAPIHTATTDVDGNFSMEGITVNTTESSQESANEFVLEMIHDSLDIGANKIFIVSPDEITDGEIHAKPTVLQENSAVELALELADGERIGISDTICIVGTTNCTIVTDTDDENRVVEFKHVPIGSYGIVQIKDSATPVDLGLEVNILAGGEHYCIYGSLSGAFAETVEIPIDESIENSMGKLSSPQELGNIIFPVTIRNATGKLALAHSKTQYGELVKPENSDDATLYWAIANAIDASLIETDSSGASAIRFDVLEDAESENHSAGIIKKAFAKADSGLSIESEIFTDNSTAISFRFNASADSMEDSTDIVILSAIKDSIGFEIRQCPDDKSSICTRIYSGLDDSPTDTTLYGKANLLDNTEHHYTLVIHKKHLSIAIDGVSVRDTDIKISDDFYGLHGLNVGNVPLQDLLLFSFDDSIRNENDKDWERLQTWLYVFHKLSE